MARNIYPSNYEYNVALLAAYRLSANTALIRLFWEKARTRQQQHLYLPLFPFFPDKLGKIALDGTFVIISPFTTVLLLAG